MSGDSAPVTVVHCWSAPRSRSTALLYSFEARGRAAASPSGTDTTSTYATYAVDEPLYRRWLIDKGDAVSRPYTQQMIDGVPPSSRGDDNDDDDDGDGEDGKETSTPTTTRTPEEDAKRWARETGSLAHRIATGARPVGPGGAVFCKHMAKHCHLYDFDNECEVGADDTVFDHMSDATVHLTFVHRHVLLIRDPVAVLSSWDVAGSVHGNNPTPDEVGIIPMMGIYSTLISRNGGIGSGGSSGENLVVILDSDQLARYPFATLKALCADLGIPFTADMLEWESGPHDCNGPVSAGWLGVPSTPTCASNTSSFKILCRYSSQISLYIVPLCIHFIFSGPTGGTPMFTSLLDGSVTTWTLNPQKTTTKIKPHIHCRTFPPRDPTAHLTRPSYRLSVRPYRRMTIFAV